MFGLDLKKYKTEVIIISVATALAAISAMLYINERKLSDNEIENVTENVLSANSPRIIVDISGAVENPGVYETTSGARLKDVIILAGGLSFNAEKDYISRNFNLAKHVTDQEKIYIPSINEVSSGIFTEPQKVLDYTAPATVLNYSVNDSNDEKISINSATLEELDTLPGIGKITAQKIIQNRPYAKIEELLNRKIVKKNIYENIINLITN